MRRRVLAVSLVVVGTLLSGCSSKAETRDGTIIDDGGGPALCEEVMDSYPPRCVDGVPVEGWDWDAVAYEQHGSVRWGHYRSMTVTRDGDHVRVQLAVATVDDES